MRKEKIRTSEELYLVETKEQISVPEIQETEERDICCLSQGRQGEIVLDSNREAKPGACLPLQMSR